MAAFGHPGAEILVDRLGQVFWPAAATASADDSYNIYSVGFWDLLLQTLILI
jgi:hypothetical protein